MKLPLPQPWKCKHHIVEDGFPTEHVRLISAVVIAPSRVADVHAILNSIPHTTSGFIVAGLDFSTLSHYISNFAVDIA